MDWLFNKSFPIFTKGSHHRNNSLVLIIQNMFHQDPSSRDISLNSKCVVVFKISRDKALIVHLAEHVYTDTYSIHQTFPDVCKDPHSCLFLDLSQSINDLLRCRTKIFPGKPQKHLNLFEVVIRFKSQLHFLHVLKDEKTQGRRALLASADD